MTQRDAFLRAIREHPDDDTPRLVYADWLDEHGDADRAEFIRAQCALARLEDGPERWELNGRCEALRQQHAAEWLGPARDLVASAEFTRGLVSRVALTAERFLGEARTEPRYALLDLGEYPGLVRREPGGRAVCGELYEVEGRLLPDLDEMEGAPDLFRLGPVAVVGQAGPVYAYFYQPAPDGLPTYGAERWDNRRPGSAP